MADSRREIILQNVETTLEGISTASGYNFDVQEVSRKYLHYSEVNDFPTIIIIPGPGEKEPHSNLEYKERFQIGLLAYVRADKDIDNAGLLSKDLEKLMQDIQKALLVDPQRGNPGWAVMTWLRRIEPYADWEQNIGICEIIIEVEYIHDFSTI